MNRQGSRDSGGRGGFNNYNSDRSVTFNAQSSYSDRGGVSYSERGLFSNRGNYRGRGSYNNSDYGSYDQHDNMRKYGNKKSNYKKTRGIYKPPRGAGPRAHLDDGDDEMGDNQPGPSHTSRFSPYGNSNRGQRGSRNNTGYRSNRGYRGNSRGRAGRYSTDYRSSKKFTGGPTAWFRVTIPYGKIYEKDWLLTSLLNMTSTPFVPQEFCYEGNAAKFLIQDSTAATSLVECSRRLKGDTGRDIIIIVAAALKPSTQNLTPDVVEKLKVAMSARYDPVTKNMDLSAFDKDQMLMAEDIKLPVTKMSVAREILNIIKENIPELESLSLENNNFNSLGVLTTLAAQAPNLLKLNLGKNNIRNLNDLDTIMRVPLLELVLDGNPLCNSYSNETIYVSAVRKKFPKVVKLDGHDLPPPITFDVESTNKVPESKGSFFGSDEQVNGLVVKFVQQYMGLYDSANRQGLLEAYHDQAVYSMTWYRNSAMTDQPSFNDYFSRNIYKVHESIARTKLLKCGRLSIVAYLSDLPGTQHDMESLVLDIIHHSQTMLVFSVQGTFREGTSEMAEKQRYVRTFNRVFVTIPHGSGISIMNEELSITNATSVTKAKAFKTPEPVASPSAAPDLTAEHKQQIQQFSKESGMNAAWSAKCLEENNWDYALSAKMFTDIHSKGGIPAEAFTQSG